MTLDELIKDLDDDAVEPTTIAQCPVDLIITTLAAFEAKYKMSSRDFRRQYKFLLSEAASANERFDYGEWYMMFTALTKQAPLVKEAIPKRQPSPCEATDEGPLKRAFILYA